MNDDARELTIDEIETASGALGPLAFLAASRRKIATSLNNLMHVAQE